MEIKVHLATTQQELEHVREIREKVFIMEQNVPEDVEIDQYEDISNHIVALLDEEFIGTARWRKTEDGIKLERFAVLKEKRGLGIGKKLVEFILEKIKNEPFVYLHAQDHVISFYRKFGFNPVGDHFYEGGISHQKMIWKQE
ncbi:MAG: GNAT family N-acetyltransferase [Candidatus Neomarinimicrobiota bacterium]|nr:GNAT family N-acetyltransferase [Candidatus Neomarinimicrobiota bacterium]